MGGEGETKAKADISGGGKKWTEKTEIGGEGSHNFLIKRV
jgi:hypothetical protein